MNLIWAPWRKAYLRSCQHKTSKCLFCHLLKSKSDKKNFILYRTPFNFAILNRYPYNNGHVMIVPNRHVASLADLSKDEILDSFNLLVQIQKTLKEKLKAHGFNIGVNISDIAGAGVPNHLHWHVVPRWKGDVNFMPVVSDTKVISESLESVYKELSQSFQAKRKTKKKRPK